MEKYSYYSLCFEVKPISKLIARKKVTMRFIVASNYTKKYYFTKVRESVIDT